MTPLTSISTYILPEEPVTDHSLALIVQHKDIPEIVQEATDATKYKSDRPSLTNSKVHTFGKPEEELEWVLPAGDNKLGSCVPVGDTPLSRLCMARCKRMALRAS